MKYLEKQWRFETVKARRVSGQMKGKNGGLKQRERKRLDGIGSRENQKISRIKNLVICRIGQRDMGKNEKISKKFILPPTPFLYTHTTIRPPRPYENVFIKNFLFFACIQFKNMIYYLCKEVKQTERKTFYINILKIF